MVGLNSNIAGTLQKWGEDTNTQREEGDVAKKAGIEVMQLEVKEHQRLRASTRKKEEAWKDSFLEPSEGV